MNPTDTLKALIFEKYKSVRQFSIEAGIPYTTIKSGLEKGIGGMAVETVIKMCKVLGTSVDEITRESADVDQRQEQRTLAAHRPDGYDEDLPAEAKQELENMLAYLKAKYRKKD